MSSVMSEEEAGWHAEADRTFTDLLAEARANPSAPQNGSELETEAAAWLVGLALRCDDREYAEGWCIRLGRELPPGHHMLGLAGLCFGHTTRRFGHISDEARALTEELAARHRQNQSDVDGRALDGLDDVNQYAPRHPRLAKVSRWIIALRHRIRGL